MSAQFDLTLPRARALLDAGSGVVFVVDRSGNLVDRAAAAGSPAARVGPEVSAPAALWAANPAEIRACAARALNANGPVSFDTGLQDAEGGVRRWAGMAAPTPQGEVLFW